MVEMNAGQMLHDVREAVAGRVPVDFYGRTGGMVPLPDEVSEQIDRLMSLPAGQPGSGAQPTTATSAMAGRART